MMVSIIGLLLRVGARVHENTWYLLYVFFLLLALLLLFLPEKYNGPKRSLSLQVFSVLICVLFLIFFIGKHYYYW